MKKGFLILVTIVFSILANAQNNFVNSELFVKLKYGFSKNNILEETKKTKQFEPYYIQSIERAFKLNTNGLDRVYLLKFKGLKIDELIIKLQETTLFEYVEKVPLYKLDYTPNDLQTSQWHLKKILAENAWNIQKGSSKIIIGLVDDALDTAHTDIEPIVWRNTAEIRGNNIDDDNNGYIDDYIGWDVADNDNNPTDNSLSHGTHCGGIAAAYTDNNSGIASIGFGCKLMAVKTGQAGVPYLTNPYAGIEYCIINKANIISMSWGGGGYSSTYQLLFDDAFSKGIICIAAAGNNNTNFTHYPAGYNYVIAVGSTSSSDAKSSFSNYGTWVDVMAPGSSIYSTLPSNTYGTYSGTSMACPLVSGLCALMLSKNPSATPTEIENCLKSSCDNIDNVNTNYTGEIGAGRINAEQSLKCLKPINALFSSNFKQVCPNDTITFTDESTPTPNSYLWLFSGGNPSTSTIANPKVKYATIGSYDVKLIVRNAQGETDTLLKKNYIKIANPTAILSGTRNIQQGNTTTIRLDFTGNAPYSVQISDGSTTQTVNNIQFTPFFHTVSPTINTNYTLTKFNDARCAGGFSGGASVKIKNKVSCENILKYKAILGDIYDENIYGVVEDKQHNIIICGFSSSTSNGFVSKINEEGVLLWTKSYGQSFYCRLNDIILTDKGYMLVGHSGFTRQRIDGWILEIDTAGTIIWSKTISKYLTDYNFNEIQKHTDGYLIVGEINSTQYTNSHNLLVKIDKNGNVKWTKGYGNSSMYYIKGLKILPNSDILFSFQYFTNRFESIALRADSIGNIIWSKKWGGAKTNYTSDILYDNDGNAFITGRYNTESKPEISLISYELNGKKRFIYNYYNNNNNFISKIIIVKDNILLMGNGVDSNNLYYNFSILIDTLGNILKTKKYLDSSFTVFNDICATNDGGLVAAGSKYINSSQMQDAIILKINCELESACNSSEIKFERKSILTETDIKISTTNHSFTSNLNNISSIKHKYPLKIICKQEEVENKKPRCVKLSSFSKISSNTTGFTNTLRNDDHFGQAVDQIGDFNNDGVNDIIVGSMFDDDGGSNTGAVYIIYLNADGSVKGKQKIAPGSGGFIGSLSGSNYFGSGVSLLPDLDNDGVNDLVIGQNFDNTGNAQAGAIWVLFMNSNGTVKSHQKIGNGLGGFPNILDNYDLFGNDVQQVGDLDNDGNTDIIVGAPYDDDGGSDRGAFYFLYLNSNGTVKSYKKISSTNGGFSGNLSNGDNFGYSLSELKDFNQDGNLDLVVGARLTDNGSSNNGAIWLLSFDNSQKVISQTKISSGLQNFNGVLNQDDGFGHGVSFTSDIDNNKVDDILVSAPYDDDGGTDKGAGWILFMESNGKVKNSIKINGSSNSILKNSLDNTDLMGWRISSISDMNSDGIDEILIGSMLDDDGGTDRGAVYILNLADT